MLLAKTYRIYEIFGMRELLDLLIDAIATPVNPQLTMYAGFVENRTRLNKGIPDSQLLIVGGAILLAELVSKI